MRNLLTSVLLLLFLCSQASAEACATRCAALDAAGMQSNASAPGMSYGGHIHAMADNSAGAAVRASSVCDDELCQTQGAAFLDRTSLESSAPNSLILMPVLTDGSRQHLPSIRISRIIRVRSTSLPAPFDLLNSKLRI